MLNFDYITKLDIKEHNAKRPEGRSGPWSGSDQWIILIVRKSGYGKRNALLNLINHEADTDQVDLYAKDLYEAKCQLLINKRKITGLKYQNGSKDFIEYSNIRKQLKYWRNQAKQKKRKILIVHDDMIADMLIVTNSQPNNSNTNPIVIELLIKERKLHISLVFIIQPYFAVPKNIRLNSTHHFVMKNLNKRELQKILFNYSSDMDFQEFVNRYKNI